LFVDQFCGECTREPRTSGDRFSTEHGVVEWAVDLTRDAENNG
jgi:hypothetical protein